MLTHLKPEQKTLLIVLTVINFFNYVDRQVIFPLFDLIKQEFQINDFQLGLLGTVFMLVHSLASVPFGYMADKYVRKKIIAWGVLFWSAASFATGLANNFRTLLSTRALVGVGEAAYAPAATAMITNNTPPTFRARAQGIFNAGMFAGGTLGAMLGGIIAYYTQGNWRLVFFLISLPGLLLAWLSLQLKDSLAMAQEHIRWNAKELFSNKAYLWLVGSGIFTTFAVSGFTAWGIEFVMRYHGFSLRDTSIILGSTLMVAGVGGVFLGSYIADAWQRYVTWGRAATVAVSLMLAGPIMYLGFLGVGGKWLFFVLFFLGTMLLSFYNGPVTAVMHDIVPVKLYGTAFSVYLLTIHLLGSTLAPAVVGKISDNFSLVVALEWCTLLVFISGLTFLRVAHLCSKPTLEPAYASLS